ncbi:Rrf2 family transcriptional regulator [Staphylococcus haemolyticus]|uniref:RrF2 family transcriptional regulator n=1 Tax=Staphylococcus haemolyticus TaxID=1283 RepID=UPI00069DD19C|nr:Rrf2 family transcriptional regulator [Staphylococcus haemolyticus]ECO1693502.1 Rrf2 family transcriptional regulator [Listeria monocytogenes]MBY6179744.1 Rrf2 family transcriptional regulator [Staphylococcaceae bacterium DP2N0-1]MCH4381946.1 Rrf2 family transcriptional regulator [Staphylococcus haemolyticus]MCH4388398.1 Rrf2 family transcriptional regulator [Staphylococcus haemolyticus]MCH4403170.1 Rrf2 family transcriptional regulator [Staphylococcus haemolyticus]
MKLSIGWEQAVYVLIMLNLLPEHSVMTSSALSDRLNVSDSYLKKIIKALVKEGLVNSSTGKNGGFSLNKPLNQITFYDVFIAIEGRDAIFSSQQLLKPFLGENEGQKAEMCVVSHALNKIEATLISTLTSITLNEVNQNIVTKYRLNDLNQWVLTNSKTL